MNECTSACPLAPAIAGALIGLAAGFVAGRLSKRGSGSAKQAKPARKPLPPPAPRTPAPEGSVEIYVGNLSYDMTEDDLRSRFGAYGAVHSVRIVTNRYNNRSKGFGFVVMPVRAEAEKAIAAINGVEVMGRAIRANEAKNP